VKFIASPDFETKNRYAFDVTVSDGELEYVKSIILTISDVNEAPTITSGSTGYVAENAATSTTIYEIKASDVDGDTLSYSLSGADASLLSLNQETGIVTLKQSADYEAKNAYAFNVNVSDDEFTATKPITIDVWNVNEFAPIITSGEGGSVDEYSPITTSFYDAEATDGDGDTVTFSLAGTDARLLNIDAITGVVTPLFVPDYDKKTSFSFSVVASDGYRTTSKDLTIAINDIAGGRPLTGTSGDDVLLGSYGDDSVTTGTGADIILTFNGDDDITVDGIGAKTIDGGTGTDSVAINVSGNSDLSSYSIKTVDDYLVLTDTNNNTIRLKNTEGLTVGSHIYTYTGSSSDGYSIQNGYVNLTDAILYFFDGGRLQLSSSHQFDQIFGQHSVAVTSDFTVFGSEISDYMNFNISRSGSHETISGDYIISLGAGNDTIDAAAFKNGDSVDMGDGDDTVALLVTNSNGTPSYASLNMAKLDGGAGTDTLSFSNMSSQGNTELTLTGGGATNFENIQGTYGADIIRGDGGNNILSGAHDDDILYGGDGDDTLSGFYGVNASSDTGNDKLYGQAGDDTLSGTAGDNILDGGTGSDTIYTGQGSDTIILRAGDGGSELSTADIIKDFTNESDIIGLDNGLQFDDLTISQGTGDLSNDTIISITSSSEYLAILEGITASDIDYFDIIPMS